MKKILLILAVSLSLFSNEYKVNKEYSTIEFEASKFLFVGVSGKFKNFSGIVTVDDKNKLSKLEGLVYVNSINTKDQERDDHLKADDYFYMVKFPIIRFNSNKIVDDIVRGTVSIKGIKKELIFKVSNIEIKNNNVNFALFSTLDRQDFMLNGSMSAVIANEIDVTVNIVASKK